jgi:hypothetical protein
MDLFTNRKPNEAQAQKLDDITTDMLGVAATLSELPDSRFKSLAMTKLEECSMWAKKATVFTYKVDDPDRSIPGVHRLALDARHRAGALGLAQGEAEAGRGGDALAAEDEGVHPGRLFCEHWRDA